MKKEEPSDTNLIERYRSGDKSALVILVERWHGLLCEKAFWVLRDKDLSKDVAQDCWIVVINKLHTLKQTDSFKSWILRIVYTKSIDIHRQRAKELTLIINSGQNSIESDDVRDDELLKKQLLAAIQALSKEKQDIIRLFYLEEYSIKKISSFLQLPIGTVKSRLFKAREKLKLILKIHHHEK